jgi:hypothetical protein
MYLYILNPPRALNSLWQLLAKKHTENKGTFTRTQSRGMTRGAGYESPRERETMIDGYGRQ